MPKVVHLPPTGALRTPVGHAIRTGETAFRRLEDLYAEGRLPARAVIVDASKARFQREFIRSLRSTGTDVTLDPKVAELSEVGKFRGTAKEAPWAVDDDARPLEPEDFEPGASIDLFGKIARMSAELGVTSVMAPTHFLRPGVDKSFRKRDFEAIASTPRGRRLVACPDRECCPRGLTSMLENHRSHITRQKFRAIDALFDVPDAAPRVPLPQCRAAWRRTLGARPRTPQRRRRSAQQHPLGLEEAHRQHDQDVRNTLGTDSPVSAAAQATTGTWSTDPSEFGMNEAAAKPIVQFIARLQEDGGLKGTDIANFTGVSKATVSRWSSGRKSPHPKPS